VQGPDGVHTHRASFSAADLAAVERLNDLIFRYIRCGHMEKAVELCHASGVAHMAAVLLGQVSASFVVDMTTALQEMHERRAVTDEHGEAHVRETGNPNRALWMHVANEITQQVRLLRIGHSTRCSLQTKLSLKERCIYASLCGRLSLLVGQCAADALHDRLWAHVVCATLDAHRRAARQLRDDE